MVLQTKDGDRLILINALAARDEKGSHGTNSKDGANKGKGGGDSMFGSEILTYLLFPASLGVVYYYQVYVKGNPLFTSGSKPSEAQKKGAVGSQMRGGGRGSRNQQLQQHERDRRARGGRAPPQGR